MTQLNLNLPVIGQTNATEDPKVRTALSDIQTVVNALDNTNIASAADINGSKLLDSSIATAKLANDAVTAAKIANDAVGSSEIAADAVGSSEIAANAVGASEIADGAVTTAKLALGPTYVTSLPASPVDGQEIYYAADTTNGVIWHLRYRSGSSSSYKWEYVGGGALRATASAGRSVTNQTSYTDVPTDTITVTIPLAGEYLVDHRAHLIVGGGARVVYSSFAITNSSNTVQTEASDTNAIIMESVNATGISGYATGTVAQIAKYEITTAGWKLRERMRTGGNYQGEIYRRNVVATPIRVG